MPSDQLALIPEEPPPPPPKNYPQLLDLLKQVTSISVVSGYLKSKALPHSAGSWEDLSEKRLLPALRKGEVSMAELLGLLSEAEEYGRSHTFLFTCSQEQAKKLTSEAHVNSAAQKLGVSALLGTPGKLLDQPAVPTIAALRIDPDERGRCVVVKIVEKRQEHKFIGEKLTGNRFTKEWEILEARAVNVVRIFAFGLLEVRIASHHSSTKYEKDILRVRKMVEALIPLTGFKEYSLSAAKAALWNRRTEMKKLIRFNNSSLRNGVGSSLSAASRPEEGDLFSDKALTESVDAFWAGGEVYCESVNIYWQAQDSGLPSKEIHMLLPELRNEFAVPANCSKADYEHVFDKLRTLSS